MNPPPAPRTRFTALAVAAALVLAAPAVAQVSRNMTLLSTLNLHPPADIINTYAGNWPYIAASPAFAVGVPRPSPTRGFAEVELTLPRSLHVRADIYDIQGRLVQTAVDGDRPAGSSVVRWNGRTAGGASAASGIYWMAIRAGQEERKLKIVVVR